MYTFLRSYRAILKHFGTNYPADVEHMIDYHFNVSVFFSGFMQFLADALLCLIYFFVQLVAFRAF